MGEPPGQGQQRQLAGAVYKGAETGEEGLGATTGDGSFDAGDAGRSSNAAKMTFWRKVAHPCGV